MTVLTESEIEMIDIPEGAKDICARITTAYIKFMQAGSLKRPTILYLGSQEWNELRFYYGRYPRVYSGLKVVLVREYSWLHVGI